MNHSVFSPSVSLVGRLRSFWLDHPIETAIPLIDLQHIYFLYTLFDLVDMTSGKSEYSGERAQKAFSRIIEFASEHFYTETILLKRLQFPEMDGHVESHNNFTEYLKDKTHARIAKDQDYTQEIAKYLLNWLFNHVMKEDMVYVRHYSSRENLLAKLGEGLVSRGEIYISESQIALYQKVTGREAHLQVCDEDLLQTILHMWRSFDLSLHIPLLDMQHLWFIQILLRLDRESRSADKELRNRILNEGMDRILEYAEIHFSTEEKLMEKFGYPGLKTHRVQHINFANSMKTRAIELQEHGADFSMFMDSTRKMKDWLLSHIAVQDKSLLWFLKKNRSDVLQISKELIQNGDAGLKRRQITLYKRIVELENSEGVTGP